MKDPKDMASFVYGVRDEVIALGSDIIKETLEDCNQLLRDSAKRKQSWEAVRTDGKTLTTCLGTVCFEKTLFRNKQTRESAYLLEEAVQTSYRKAGEETSLTDQVCKQTVKNKLHNLTFSQQREEKLEKKAVEFLYIDADEDHVSLQFKKKKGDLEVGENNWKNNYILAKLVYVYEGIEPESPKSKRHKLVNPHYFSRV